MSTPARIDELRKKFDENPRRYFAPLANEYRKAGDLAQAVALCREFLPNQPGHMSGHIVFGQALYELGLLEESRSVFTSALTLDPENLIALRHLGDIAKVTGDAAGARRWYERVLDADPRNDDIAAQLATLATSTTPAVPVRRIPDYGIGAPPASATPSSFSPSSVPTPAYGVGAPIDAVPTPEAAMRAVDFDQINERVAASTPLHVSAVDDAAGASEAADAPASGSTSAFTSASGQGPQGQRGFEPLDLDAMDGPAHNETGAEQESTRAAEADQSQSGAEALVDAENTAETADARESMPAASGDVAAAVSSARTSERGESPDAAASGTVEMDARSEHAESTHEDHDVDANVTADTAQPDSFAEVGNALAGVAAATVGLSEHADWGDAFAAHDARASENTDGESDATDEFEGGILAPEWPDASAILASISSPRSRTPISVEITPDAVEAFGREAHDPISQERESYAAGDDAGDDVDDGHLDEVEGFGETHAAEAALPASALEFASDAEEFSNDESSNSESSNDDFSNDEPSNELQPSAAAPMFVTETMGELLVTQGFLSRAVEVYDELVRRRPYDPVLTSRLAELRERLVAESIAPEGPSSESTEAQVAAEYSESEIAGESDDDTWIPDVPVEQHEAPSEPSMPAEITARQLFAQLAARRVMRPTPARAMRAVHQEQQPGLDSLFGSSIPSTDDAAARALADAFAPISDAEMSSGASLGLDFNAAQGNAYSAPAWISASHDAVDTRPLDVAHGSERGGSAPTKQATPPASSGFSFDRFFPDPAAPTAATPTDTASSQTPAAPNSSQPTDDLAQFSAWLKGLGNS